MPQNTCSTKFFLSLGILFSLVLCARSQNLETSKIGLKQERKDQLKSSILSASENKTIISREDIFSTYKLVDNEKKEKYTVDYLNNSIKIGLENMVINPPGLSDNGFGVIIGGLNLSNPKAWFTAAKLKKRKRKMEQITTYVYSID
ncbi:hypothetical protein CLV62_102218 [Dysgonomonas alginatilytica]|uniref:Uncharacterized protein n=1 Tax=Dysgonomonas alginatilytica TaxID=1605892 RepID=A0A2V3PUX6_9BACT|nr:hypothetical protein [Dysgonomonas alginatilytica]PXV68186.1 hypothetical protein CLV62_102218 [Dysgonomonas alginatilytica]